MPAAVPVSASFPASTASTGVSASAAPAVLTSATAFPAAAVIAVTPIVIPALTTTVVIPAPVITVPLMVSPGLEASGFGAFPGTNTAVISVIATVGQYGSDAGIAAPSYQLWNSNIAQIGGAQSGVASQNSANIDSVSFTGVSPPQLNTLRFRTYSQGQPEDHGGTDSVDWVALTTVSATAFNSAIIQPAITAAVAFLPVQIAIAVNASAVASALTVTSALPQPAAGRSNAVLSQAAFSIVTNQPQVIVTTTSNIATTVTALTCASSFPACTVNNVSTAVLPVIPAVITDFLSCTITAGTSVACTVSALTCTTTLPGCTINQISTNVIPPQLGISYLFPATLITAVVNLSFTPGQAVITTLFPACTASDNVDGPYYATNVNTLSDGTGTWVNAGNITGPPGSGAAAWTVP